MQDLYNTFISNGKFSYQWVFENLKSKDMQFRKFLSLDDDSKKNMKEIVKAFSFDLSSGKGCFSEVFKVVFVADDGSNYHTILKIPGSSHFEDAINSSICIDDNGNKFKTCDEMIKTIVTMHNRECDFYNKIKFTACPIPEVFEAIHWIPHKKSYGCLLMRDIGNKAKMQNLSESLTPGQAMNVIKIIAQLHAFSIKNMDRIKKYDLSFPMQNYDFSPIIKEHVKILNSKFANEFGNLFDKFLPFVSTQKFANYVNELSYVYFNLPKLLNHGDIWTNNIYFKTDENGCILNEVKALLDWQFLHLGNPTFDIARFLIISVNSDIRCHFKDIFFNHYYDVLSNELGDIPVPFSLENFKECFKFSQLFQTYQSILMISIFTNYIPDENNKNFMNQKYKEDILILRLKHALQDGIDIIENDLKNFEYKF